MPDFIHFQEKLLLERVAEGDERAFSEIFYAYHNKLVAFVIGWTKSPALAEEIVQDVFLKIWKNRETLPAIGKFDSYLFVISRNYTFDKLRLAAKERVQQKLWSAAFEQEDFSKSDSLADLYVPLIEEAIVKLPPQQQKVYFLKRVKRLKYEEISTQLNISAETARKHLAAAIRNIIQFVKQHHVVLSWVLFFAGFK